MLSQDQLCIAESSRKRKATSNKAAKRKKQEPVDRPLRVPSPVDDNEEGTVDVPQEETRDDEILSGHGGLSNHYVRNKRFRQIVADIMKENNRRMGGKKTVKTTSPKISSNVSISKEEGFLSRNKKVG